VSQTSETYGRRLVTHEYPQRENPFVEDMGRKSRKFELKALIVGDTWKDERDALVAACEKIGVGTLIHPAYGELVVTCESCTVSEAYIKGAGACEVSLVFVTDREKDDRIKKPASKLNTVQKLRRFADEAKKRIGQASEAIYFVKTLPYYAKTYINNYVTAVTGVNPLTVTQVIRDVEDLKDDLFNFSSVSSKYGKLVTDIRKTATELGVITPLAAIASLDSLISQAKKFPVANPIITTALVGTKLITLPGKVKLQQSTAALESAMISMAVLEKAVTLTYVDFSDVETAKALWRSTLDDFDYAIDTAAGLNIPDAFAVMREAKTIFQLDIAERAPTLDRISTISVTDPTPATVLAFEKYGNLSNLDKFIQRNRLVNPLFTSGAGIEYVR
jgi:prophage DNA circulation protein